MVTRLLLCGTAESATWGVSAGCRINDGGTNWTLGSALVPSNLFRVGASVVYCCTTNSMGASTLNLTPAERQSFAQLYAKADPTNTGVVSGDAAVKFFEGFKLPTLTLGQIWSIADDGNNGFLTPNAFGVALRLIARAQRGESVNEQAVHTPGAPPVYQSAAGVPLSTDLASSSILTSEDKARFTRIFAMVGPKNGVLSGEQAKDVFLKSKLPYAKLGAIWNLADTKQRGALDLTDFIIGMHFIQGTMNGTIASLPATLPPGLYEAASEPSTIPTTPIQPQHTGADSYMGGAPVLDTATPARSTTQPSPVLRQAPSTEGWDILPADKARYDGFFDSLDADRMGFVEGSVVVPFFLQSGLDESTLAHVWDLADLTQSGSLSRDEFAVAMHLINDRIAGKELPQQLPASLMPPSMRSQALPQAVDVNQTETQRELFSLLDSDEPPTMSKSEAASAFGTVPNTVLPSTSMPAPEPPATRSHAASALDAVEAASSPTSNAKPHAISSKNIPSLFDDDFSAPPPAMPTPVRDARHEQTEEALTSSNKALDDVKTRHTAAKSTLASQTTTLAELEGQLEQAKIAFAKEETALAEVESKVQAQDAEIVKLRQDVIRQESELSAIRTQRDELEQRLLQDRESAHSLKRQLTELQEQTMQLREERDRLEQESLKEAGMAATTNKQLAAAREERDALSRQSMPKASTPSSSGRRMNPFEALFSTSPKTEEPDRFESLYGFDSFTAAGAGVAAATAGQNGLRSPAPNAAQLDAEANAPMAHQSVVTEPASGSKHVDVANDDGEQDTYGPEQPDAMQFRDAIQYDSADRLDRGDTSRDDIDAMPLPGGFPSQSDGTSKIGTRAPSAMTGPGTKAAVPASREQQVPMSASSWHSPASVPKGKPGMPVQVIDLPPPEPRSPNANAAAMPAADVMASSIPPSSASTVVLPSTSEPQTPNVNMSGPAQDDFESAFSHMGLANVVHKSSGQTQPAQVSAGTPPSAAAVPAGTSSPHGVMPAYLQTSSQVVAPRARSASGAAAGGTPGLSSVSTTTAVPAMSASMPQTGASTPALATAPRDAFDDHFSPTKPLSPPQPANDRAPSPAMPGDIGPVRQLCQMGFSRSSVVKALERSNYRTERALERLLAMQSRQ